VVLDEIVNAVSNLDRPEMKQFQSGTWEKMPPEREVTRDISIQLGQTHGRKIWTASNTHQHLPDNAPETSFRSALFQGHSEIDASWAQGLDSDLPSHILEVKLRSSAAPSQDHYRFFSEVCAVAAEILYFQNREGDLSGYCTFITGVGERERTHWFSDMASVDVMRIQLEPSSAIDNPGPVYPEGDRRPYWIDRDGGLFRPEFQSAFNKIFSGIETAHYAGIFRTEGILSVNCTVTQRETENGYWIVQYRVDDVELIGTDLPIEEWLP